MRSNIKSFGAFSLFALLLMASPAYAGASKKGGLPFWGFALDGHPITETMLKGVEEETGLSPEIVVFFLQWPTPGEKDRVQFPRDSLEAIWNRGAVPCLTWEPMYYQNGKEFTIPGEEILGGKYDPYILDFARQARDWKRTFLIRFAQEMNIERYHWGTGPAVYGPSSPQIFRRMFQKVVSLFRKVSADNALWVFCPNAESVPNISYRPDASWNEVRNYYPGDEHVDILGIDGYNWGTSSNKRDHGWDSSWKSFEEIFRPVYEEFPKFASPKPVFVFETASVSRGGDKTKWIREAVETAKKWNMQGVIWFQVNKDNDWRINSDGNRRYLSVIRTRSSASQSWIMGFREDQERRGGRK